MCQVLARTQTHAHTHTHTHATRQLYEELLQDAHGNPPGAPSDVFWLFDTPWAVRKMLGWVSKRYSRPEIWVTESGAPAPGEGGKALGEALKDTYRLDYYRCVCVCVHVCACVCACVRIRALQLHVYWQHTCA